MEPAFARLAAHTSAQYSLVTRKQAFAAAVTRGELAGLLNAQLLEVRYRGVYAVKGSPATWEQGALASVLAGGDGALASHGTAARCWDFDFVDDLGFEIAVLRPRHPEVEGVLVHSTAILTADDIAIRHGIPCTSFERTLCDSTTRLSQFQSGRVLDQGLRKEVTTLARVRACVLRLDSGPHRRLSAMHALLAQRDESFNPGGSNAELRVLDVAHRFDLPEPEQQVPVRVGKRLYYLDYAYRDTRSFVEYYELRSHGTASSVAYDSDRISDLSSVGWRPIIVTDMNTDAEIADRIRQARTAARVA